MTLQEIKLQWNSNLRRIKKAEEVAESDPAVFDRYMSEFNKICEIMSDLMNQYEKITGTKMPEYEFENGFD